MLRDQMIEKCISHRLRKKAALPKQQNFQIKKVMEGKDSQQLSENETSSVN